MGPKTLAATLDKILLKTNRPVYIEGDPGIGKSSVAQQLAERHKLGCCIVYCLLHDPSDLKFPIVDVKNKSIDWVNSIFPKDPAWEGVIILEEIDKCGTMMQGALLQPVLERRIGSDKIPDGAKFILIGNKASNQAGGNDIITPLRSRCINLELDYSVDDWDEWAVSHGIDFRVRMYCTKVAPGSLCKFDPNQKCMPLPRTWHIVSDIRQAYGTLKVDAKSNDDMIKSLEMFEPISGAVGAGEAARFLAYCRIADNLPDIDELLANPGKGKIPDSPEVLWSICGAVTEKVREHKGKISEAAFAFADRLPDEYGVMLGKDIMRVWDGAVRTKECTKWVAKHRNVIIESNSR